MLLLSQRPFLTAPASQNQRGSACLLPRHTQPQVRYAVSRPFLCTRARRGFQLPDPGAPVAYLKFGNLLSAFLSVE